jgi:hypothetical protein
MAASGDQCKVNTLPNQSISESLPSHHDDIKSTAAPSPDPVHKQNARLLCATHQVRLQFLREQVTDCKSVKMGITVAPSVAMQGEPSPDNVAPGKLIFAAPFATNFRDLSTIAVTARLLRSRSGNKVIMFTIQNW